MKRAAVRAALALLLLAGPAAGQGEPRPARRFANPLLDDVAAMTRAEIPDATILAFLRVRRARLESDITAQDLVRLRDDGVHDEILRYIASQSGVEAPPVLPPLPRREGAPLPGPASGGDPASESRPVESDEVPDVPLIMGVYDTIPEGGYPCWPPSLAPYDCGGGPIFVDGVPVSPRGDSLSRRRPVQDRTPSASPAESRGRHGDGSSGSGARSSGGGRGRR